MSTLIFVNRRRTPTWLGSLAVLCLVPFALAASDESSSEKVSKTVPYFFSDCSHLIFDSREGEELTRAERIAVLNADIEANLGQHEACMAAAAAAGQDRVSSAGAAGGASGSADSSQQATQAQQTSEDENEQSEETDTSERASADPSRQHQGSERQAGSSAVCDAIKTGLDEAATESEKEHFEALAKEYGCQP
ncbi:hypothetical protein [Aliidiomarina indica]|uniref:hypothetical protein n=1 Tax=Aliidiomarina indica TaxID=2749147 RepID=UPI00188DEC3F|nr:hypothetical protein [Aliidiomarina indica]